MTHIYQFKVTLKQQLLLLSHAFLTIIAVSLGFVFVLHLSLSDKAFIITFLFMFFLDILPTIILHLQYWGKNHSSILMVNTDSEEFIYSTSKQKLSYLFSDIEKVDYYRNLGKGSGWYSFGEYRYYKLTCIDKTEIVLTCLMINNIETTLEVLLGIKSERHAKWLCLID